MDIKSLMVGDWVLMKPFPNSEPIPNQIVGIEYNSWEGADYCDWVNCKEWGELSLNEIEPIPLTKEILEKIGFTDVINPPYKERVLHHVIDGYCVKINVVNKDANMIITPLAERTLVRRRADFIFPNPDYVHELQHAMRICGISKEIEL